MNNKFLIMLLCLFLVACGGEPEERVYDPKPSLVGFDIVDSYGVDTAKSRAPLALDPYTYGGLFDVYWRVNSLDDYRVNVRINSIADTYHSTLVYSEVCGAGRACDQGGGVICEYTPDLYLSCNNDRYPTDIASLMKRIPQDLYLILEVCDLDSPYCAYMYYPVSMQ